MRSQLSALTVITDKRSGQEIKLGLAEVGMIWQNIISEQNNQQRGEEPHRQKNHFPSVNCGCLIGKRWDEAGVKYRGSVDCVSWHYLEPATLPASDCVWVPLSENSNPLCESSSPLFSSVSAVEAWRDSSWCDTWFRTGSCVCRKSAHPVPLIEQMWTSWSVVMELSKSCIIVVLQLTSNYWSASCSGRVCRSISGRDVCREIWKGFIMRAAYAQTLHAAPLYLGK